jgi:hypothetical protein
MRQSHNAPHVIHSALKVLLFLMEHAHLFPESLATE